MHKNSYEDMSGVNFPVEELLLALHFTKSPLTLSDQSVVAPTRKWFHQFISRRLIASSLPQRQDEFPFGTEKWSY